LIATDNIYDANKLYFAAEVQPEYLGNSLDSVEVLWYGTQLSPTADAVQLNDFGTDGDIISNDGIYSRKISNTNLDLMNFIPDTAKGKVYLVKATSRGHTRYTFKMEMLRPHLKEIVLYANGEWQHFGNKGALCVYGEKEELKIGVIQTIPFTRNGLCVKILGKTYRIPSSMSCREPLVIPLSGLSGDVRALTVRIQRENINLGRVFLVCPLKSGLENSR
jgi:hypothetical protein